MVLWIGCPKRSVSGHAGKPFKHDFQPICRPNLQRHICVAFQKIYSAPCFSLHSLVSVLNLWLMAAACHLLTGRPELQPFKFPWIPFLLIQKICSKITGAKQRDMRFFWWAVNTRGKHDVLWVFQSISWHVKVHCCHLGADMLDLLVKAIAIPSLLSSLLYRCLILSMLLMAVFYIYYYVLKRSPFYVSCICELS